MGNRGGGAAEAACVSFGEGLGFACVILVGMTILPELTEILVSTTDTLGGSVRFAGTRVPVQCLLDNLSLNHSVDYFLEDYPDVTREQAEAVIRWQQNFTRQAFGLDLVSL